MTIDISSNSLLDRLINVGIGDLPGDRLKELANSLEDRAYKTGLASPYIVAETIWAIDSFFSEYGEAGGLKSTFLSELDKVLIEHVHKIQKSDPILATSQARQLLKEIRIKLSNYHI